ncbi:hypothetical protein RRG08_047655 [Elysia crispata]|uniref:Uncharacterized protein n=1 Tax=Elysia crispata TaxID=231223 RepID=A0AAE0ZWJ6_9GAST|nr:hypothetical protein RRG08_047655 [Elysia crispata]
MIKEWNENDDIIAAHRETCTFHNLNTSFSRDQEQPTAVFEAETFLDTNNRYTFHELSIRNKQPKKVEYAGHQARLDSYKDGWKEEFAVTPKQLSEAGFYYAGYRDCARCSVLSLRYRFKTFGLKNDDTWVEHARESPFCTYLLHIVGTELCDKVQSLNKNRGTPIPLITVLEHMDTIPDFFKQKEAYRNPEIDILIDEGFDRDQATLLQSVESTIPAKLEELTVSSQGFKTSTSEEEKQDNHHFFSYGDILVR